MQERVVSTRIFKEFTMAFNSKLVGPKCIEMDELAQKDFTYRPSTEEFERYKKNWYISLNTSGRSAPMKLRSDFREALTNMHRLHVSLEKSDLNQILSGSIRNGIRRLLHPAHHGGSGMTTGGVHQSQFPLSSWNERHQRTG